MKTISSSSKSGCGAPVQFRPLVRLQVSLSQTLYERNAPQAWFTSFAFSNEALERSF